MGKTVEGIMDPGSAVIGGVFGGDSDVYKTYNQIADPMDLWGSRAAQTQDEVSSIATKGAADSIAAQEEIRAEIGRLMAPYQQRGDAALGDFTAMSTSGQAQTPLSQEYQWQRGQGIQNINRGMGAQGRRLSTARDKKMGGFLNALGQEEAGRQYGRSLDAIKMGQGAIDTLGGANSAAGQNVGSLYGNLGSTLNSGLQNYGNQRNQSLQQAGNAMSGLSNYMTYNQQQQPDNFVMQSSGN